MNSQVIVFIFLLIFTAIGTAFTYHVLNQEWITFHAGEKLFHDQHFSSAITVYEEALALGFKKPKVYERLGDSYTAEGKFTEAIHYYQEYLVLDPDNPHMHFSLARVLAYTGNFEESTKEYKTAISLKKKKEQQHETSSPSHKHE